VSSCTLHNFDCSLPYSTAYPSGRLTIAGTTPFAITAVIGVEAGWSETICLKCSNGALYDTETRQNFVITQAQNPCRISLSNLGAAPTSHPTMTYDHLTTTELVGGWSLLFVSSDQTNCAISACLVMAQGCLSVYGGNKLTIGSTNPFTITARKDYNPGYTETVCIKCTNDAGALTLDT
jgi:hypothetical protein